MIDYKTGHAVKPADVHTHLRAVQLPLYALAVETHLHGGPVDSCDFGYWNLGRDGFAPVKLKVSSHRRVDGKRGKSYISVENPSKALAFFICVKVGKGVGGREVLPIIYQDNYFSLLPGETREISASYRMADLGGKKPVVEVSGWNVSH